MNTVETIDTVGEQQEELFSIFDTMCEEFGRAYVLRVLKEVKYTHDSDWDSARDWADICAERCEDAPSEILEAICSVDDPSPILDLV
jgi:hypothetical protein